jgi:hypothetical protein
MVDMLVLLVILLNVIWGMGDMGDSGKRAACRGEARMRSDRGA